MDSKDEASFYERYKSLRELPTSGDIEADIVQAARQKYAATLDELRAYLQNPDGKFHDLGVSCFALRLVVDLELNKHGHAKHVLKTVTRRKSGLLSVTFERILTIIVFSDDMIANDAVDLFKYAQSLMMAELDTSVVLLTSLVEIRFPNLWHQKHWITPILAERGLTLSFVEDFGSTINSWYVEWTVSCAKPSTDVAPLPSASNMEVS